MSPVASRIGAIAARSPMFNPSISSETLRAQWSSPHDVFSILLLLGADVIVRALAQITNGYLTFVSFSFGWVAYSVVALTSAWGENKLMPQTPDCSSIVVNGKNGNVKTNSNWILGRILRDFDYWQDRAVTNEVERVLNDSLEAARAHAQEQKHPEPTKPPSIAGLVVSVYKVVADDRYSQDYFVSKDKYPTQRRHYDVVDLSGICAILLQLGVAAAALGAYGDWTIMLLTLAGNALAIITSILPQWSREKWTTRRLKKRKTIILTRGNGSQHAIVLISDVGGLDLEAQAGSTLDDSVSASYTTRLVTSALCVLWILFLVSATGLQEHTWFLFAVGSIGMLHNTFVAGWPRKPAAYGFHFEFTGVYGSRKVHKALLLVDEEYPGVGESLVNTFFPNGLHDNEKQDWAGLKQRTGRVPAEKTVATIEAPSNVDSKPAEVSHRIIQNSTESSG